jgi:hypothetical protein
MYMTQRSTNSWTPNLEFPVSNYLNTVMMTRMIFILLTQPLATCKGPYAKGFSDLFWFSPNIPIKWILLLFPFTKEEVKVWRSISHKSQSQPTQPSFQTTSILGPAYLTLIHTHPWPSPLCAPSLLGATC